MENADANPATDEVTSIFVRCRGDARMLRRRQRVRDQ
jgi:hypothetical protein